MYRYNGRQDETEFHIENAVAYIDQIDRHAPRLTVDETFEFAFQCKTGGQMFREVKATNEAMKTAMEKARKDRLRVNVTMQMLGLSHVRDTYVGDQTVQGQHQGEGHGQNKAQIRPPG